MALHFRTQHPEAPASRIDVMSRLRGVDNDFETLWDRRTTLETDLGPVEVLAFQDLVQAKKTQRDKDWPMLRRLLEAHYQLFADEPAPERIDFWLKELRTPELLRDVARSFPDAADRLTKERPLIAEARDGDPVVVERLLHEEEFAEREADRAYWLPLLQELERLKGSRPRRSQSRY